MLQSDLLVINPKEFMQFNIWDLKFKMDLDAQNKKIVVLTHEKNETLRNVHALLGNFGKILMRTMSLNYVSYVIQNEVVKILKELAEVQKDDLNVLKKAKAALKNLKANVSWINEQIHTYHSSRPRFFKWIDQVLGAADVETILIKEIRINRSKDTTDKPLCLDDLLQEMKSDLKKLKSFNLPSSIPLSDSSLELIDNKNTDAKAQESPIGYTEENKVDDEKLTNLHNHIPTQDQNVDSALTKDFAGPTQIEDAMHGLLCQSLNIAYDLTKIAEKLIDKIKIKLQEQFPDDLEYVQSIENKLNQMRQAIEVTQDNKQDTLSEELQRKLYAVSTDFAVEFSDLVNKHPDFLDNSGLMIAKVCIQAFATAKSSLELSDVSDEIKALKQANYKEWLKMDDELALACKELNPKTQISLNIQKDSIEKWLNHRRTFLGNSSIAIDGLSYIVGQMDEEHVKLDPLLADRIFELRQTLINVKTSSFSINDNDVEGFIALVNSLISSLQRMDPVQFAQQIQGLQGLLNMFENEYSARTSMMDSITSTAILFKDIIQNNPKAQQNPDLLQLIWDCKERISLILISEGVDEPDQIKDLSNAMLPFSREYGSNRKWLVQWMRNNPGKMAIATLGTAIFGVGMYWGFHELFKTSLITDSKQNVILGLNSTFTDPMTCSISDNQYAFTSINSTAPTSLANKIFKHRDSIINYNIPAAAVEVGSAVALQRPIELIDLPQRMANAPIHTELTTSQRIIGTSQANTDNHIIADLGENLSKEDVLKYVGYGSLALAVSSIALPVLGVGAGVTGTLAAIGAGLNIASKVGTGATAVVDIAQGNYGAAATKAGTLAVGAVIGPILGRGVAAAGNLVLGAAPNVAEAVGNQAGEIIAANLADFGAQAGDAIADGLVDVGEQAGEEIVRETMTIGARVFNNPEQMAALREDGWELIKLGSGYFMRGTQWVLERFVEQVN